MTPLAKAIEMPTRTQPQEPTHAEPRSLPAKLATYPRELARGGWLATLAAEQIHALATHVLARHTERGLRTVAMTSALAGEGKTTLTLALAEKLASADKRVLIIDLDVYRSTLSRAAGIADMSGAMESSSSNNGEIPFHTYLTECPGVSIMPTGKVHAANGTPLLNPNRITELCKRAFDEFDLILLDCPPLMPVADTHVIGEVTDSAILIVRAGSTPREVLDRALTDFGKEKFFAAVLNRARPSAIPYFREVYGYYRRG